MSYKENIKLLQMLVLSIILSGTVSLSTAQTVEYDDPLFSFKIHDNLKYEVLQGYPVYRSATIFLSIKKIDTYDNAGKYADDLESKFLDQEDVYTSRGIDTLDGWPIILLIRKDESKEDVFVQKFYLFDDGKMVYNISISGYKNDERVIGEHFQVTKSSFRFTTRTKYKAGIVLTLPKFMSDQSLGFWSHLYNKDEKIDIPIYVNKLDNVSYASRVKDATKEFKSLKAPKSFQDTFTAGGANVTKFSATYTKKFKNNTSEERSEYMYVIELPKGGVTVISYEGTPGVADIMNNRLDPVVRALTIE